jgi:uncharacterized protein (DUF433 family)
MAVLTKPAIVKTPEVCFGKPRIDGTRISVDLIDRIARSGRTVDEILEMYPHLSGEQIRAALKYAEDHPEEMAEIEERLRAFREEHGLPKNWW